MEDSVKKRNIDYLWHFTRLENVHSILANGLMPRADLEAANSTATYNDAYRADGQKSANCLSIGHPNYKMFYRLRQENPGVEWVVVGVKPDVLWLKDCAFCMENAASGNVTCIPIDQRRGVDAFEMLFDPVEGTPTRLALNLPDYCPTNPQAEVLVFDTIAINDIVGIAVPNKARETELRAQYPEITIEYYRALYNARLDYKYW